jgi:flagellar basal-body rod protein FlgC
VDVVREMVDLMTASRAYEANATAVEVAKQMAMRTLDIGRGV